MKGYVKAPMSARDTDNLDRDLCLVGMNRINGI